MSDLPVVIRVETPREVLVALPRTECTEEVLTLARLVLSSAEFEELRTSLLQSSPPAPRDVPPGYRLGVLVGSRPAGDGEGRHG
jgi:hypothetical protein